MTKSNIRPLLEEIESKARSLLSSSPISELRRLKIESADDGLCLLGSLSTWHHKQLAQELVRRLSPAPIPIRNLTSVRSEYER
ncbi:MAG: hypothetical protein J6A23_00465 [Thermoguttaceae bacterium]|nr:hypothetical protein [Thermoguttaceae bacterium]